MEQMTQFFLEGEKSKLQDIFKEIYFKNSSQYSTLIFLGASLNFCFCLTFVNCRCKDVINFQLFFVLLLLLLFTFVFVVLMVFLYPLWLGQVQSLLMVSLVFHTCFCIPDNISQLQLQLLLFCDILKICADRCLPLTFIFLMVLDYFFLVNIYILFVNLPIIKP